MLVFFFLLLQCALAQPQTQPGAPAPASAAQESAKESLPAAPKPRATFVELGSVQCIPCRQMQPIMASVQKKYGGQIKVVFYDVWKKEQRVFADQYRIKLIPTQVFLDQDGKEFFRHEGFLPEKDIDKLLQDRGLKLRGGA
jgi:thioredoxin 1